MSRRIAAVLLSVLLTGCGDDTSEEPDAGTEPDASVEVDAGTNPDAGDPDAGPSDAGQSGLTVYTSWHVVNAATEARYCYLNVQGGQPGRSGTYIQHVFQPAEDRGSLNVLGGPAPLHVRFTVGCWPEGAPAATRVFEVEQTVSARHVFRYTDGEGMTLETTPCPTGHCR